MTIATLAWGALAFGAVYPWAFCTLAVLAVMAGTSGLLAARPGSSTYYRTVAPVVSRGLLLSLAAIAAAVALQLVPLPLDVFTRLNPNAVDLLRRSDVAFAFKPGPHALSVWPADTQIGLGLFVSLAVLLIGATRLFSITGARRLIEIMIIFGVTLAIIGIVQRPLSPGKMYGFWTPQEGGQPFGPFVNKNHFAGWMLMVVPLALGYLCSRIAKGLGNVKPAWRDRLLWLSSPDANKLILTSSGIAVMGLALVLTFSRSGISAIGVALAITGWFALRRLHGRSRKAVTLGYLVLLLTLVLAWVGIDTVVTRFASSNWGEMNGRSGAWADAISTFRRHWLTGTGLDTYQVVNIFYQQHEKATFVSSAHNDYLQLAAEGGVLLIVPVFVCVLVFARDVRRRFREDGQSSAYWLRAGAVTGLVAIALQETVEFSLQMPGNAALFAVLCAIALHTAPQRMVR